MKGNGTGSLRVEIELDNGERNVIWKLSGEQGESWMNAQVGINSNTRTYM